MENKALENESHRLADFMKSAESFLKALGEYYVLHPDQYQKEANVVCQIVDRAKIEAERDKALKCGCKYMSDGLCAGQKGMPQCTPMFGYCPLARDNK